MRIRVTDIEISNTLYFLEMTPRWVSAEELTATLGHNSRIIRYIANQSGGRIISSTFGYKATSNASVAEINTCLNRLQHQAHEMLDRALSICAYALPGKELLPVLHS